MEVADSSPASDALHSADDATRLKQGDTIGSRFVVDEYLREDAAGRIYRAVDEKSGRKVSILLLDPELFEDRETASRLRAAAKTATELTHKNIVSIYGMGKDGNRRYLAREYVDGQTLVELLDKKAAVGKSFTLKGAYNLIAHICNGVQFARQQMPHGTLRPSVVLINRTGRVRVSDFGLHELRATLHERRSEMSSWDQACFPQEWPEADDRYAIGAILFSLLAGVPPDGRDAQLPEAVARRIPAEAAALIARCLQPDHPERFSDPNAIKTEFLNLVERAGGSEQRSRPGVESLGASAASIEVLEEQRTPNPVAPAPRKKQVRRSEAGGFVIPELKSASQIEDDGTTQRWLVERSGTDYGPFTSKQVVEQLFNEEVTAETVLYDIETDRRLALSEFSAFDEALVSWIHEKAEREKRRAEAAAEAAARRRGRILLGIVLFIVLGAGGAAGGWFWYRSSLPAPVRAHLPDLVARVQGTLPSVALPEELPETPAEVKERRKRSTDAAATRKAQEEERRIATERRMAASSELDVGSGDGRTFDRAAFDAALASRQSRLLKCLEGEARRDPSQPSFTVMITVIPRGNLINVHMPNATSAGNSCVRDALRDLKVPPFDGGNQKVSLPFSVQ